MSAPETSTTTTWISDEIKKCAGAFATQDFRSALRDIVQSVARQVEERPYQAIQVAIAAGYGLASARPEQLKKTALQAGRYVLVNSLSGVALDGNTERKAG